MAEEESEQQLEARLLSLENEGMADRRAELAGPRWLSLINDETTGRAYVLDHGVDESDGLEVPPGTEIYEFRSFEQAEEAYAQMLAEADDEGELVEDDTDDDLGDYETGGAELFGLNSDQDEDELTPDALDEER